MSEWKKVRLGEVADVKGGKRLPAGMMLTEEQTNHPYIRIRDLTDVKNLEITTAFQYVTDDVQQRISRYIVDEGDVLISIVGTVGLVSIVGRSLTGANLTENCVKIINLRGLDNNYLYYYLKSASGQYQIRNLTVGAVQPKLPITNILSIQLSLPPLPTQRKIAAVLSSLDDKIENNRKICANLEAQAQAIFKSWFVDFYPFGGKMPQGWKMGKLGDVGNIVGGATPSKAKAEFYTEEGIAWLTPKDLSLQQTKFVAKGEIDITEEGYKSASVRMLPKGSVLFSSRAPIGYVAIAKNELCTNQGFKSVVPFDWVGSEFVYQLLRMMTPVIEERASGSTFKEISSSGMKELPVIVPSKNVLHEFSSITLPMGESQKSLEDETRTLAALRDALLPKLMSGEIDVEKVKISA